MLTRDLVMPLFVAGAVGLPILLSSPDGPASSEQVWLQPAGTANGVPGLLPSAGPAHLYGQQTWVFPGTAAGPDLSAQPLEFLPINDLRQVFSFDLTAEAVRSRFQRISLVTNEEGWQGYRTEIVTGTGVADLHGCMTWYFDGQGRLKRMAFRGWTGNHQQLRQLLQSDFQLKPQSGARWTEALAATNWGKTGSAAIFQLPQVVSSQIPEQQLAALIELNQSGSNEISPMMKAALQNGTW